MQAGSHNFRPTRIHNPSSATSFSYGAPLLLLVEAFAWRDVRWVDLSDVNRVRTRFAAYGNEPEIGFLYQHICMFVDVGPLPVGARAGGV